MADKAEQNRHTEKRAWLQHFRDLRTSRSHKMCVFVGRRTCATIWVSMHRGGVQSARVLLESRCVGVETAGRTDTAFLVSVGLTTQVKPRALTHPPPPIPDPFLHSSLPASPPPFAASPLPLTSATFPASIHPSILHIPIPIPIPIPMRLLCPQTRPQHTNRFLRCARMPSGEKLHTTHDNSKARGFGVCALCGPRGRYT